jgi:hypothetical protein
MSQSEPEQQKKERGMKGGEQDPWFRENRQPEDRPENREVKPVPEEQDENTNYDDPMTMGKDPKGQQPRKNEDPEE